MSSQHLDSECGAPASIVPGTTARARPGTPARHAAPACTGSRRGRADKGVECEFDRLEYGLAFLAFVAASARGWHGPARGEMGLHRLRARNRGRQETEPICTPWASHLCLAAAKCLRPDRGDSQAAFRALSTRGAARSRYSLRGRAALPRPSGSMEAAVAPAGASLTSRRRVGILP